jgi:streptogramin lyase
MRRGDSNVLLTTAITLTAMALYASPSVAAAIPAPEVAATTGSAVLLTGIGSDGAEGVWFSDIAPSGSYLAHYTPGANSVSLVDIKPGPPDNGQVFGIAPGLNGDEWFTRTVGNQVSRVGSDGMIYNVALPTSSSFPHDVVVDSQGNVWFAEERNGCVLGRISPTGTLKEYAVSGFACSHLTVGPDGNIWLSVTNQVLKVSAVTGIVLAAYAVPSATGLASLDGKVWVGEFFSSRIAAISSSGQVTEHKLPRNSRPQLLTAGPDDAIWFTEPAGSFTNLESSGGIGRLPPKGTAETIPLGTEDNANGITATHNAIYFTQQGPTPALMRIQLASLVPGEGVYVALGDSYSSGEGNSPYVSSNACDRSESAYGPLLDRDRALGPMTFRACSGAETNDLFDMNHVNPAEPRQLSWLTTATKVVTLTIGGNDAGFSVVLNHCVTGPFHESFGCSQDVQLNTEIQSRLAALAGTSSASTTEGLPIWPIESVVDAIHAKAPAARILVGGYPRLFGGSRADYEQGTPAPSGRACQVGTVEFGGTQALLVDYSDAQWLNGLARMLNATIKNSVRTAASQGIAVSFVEPSQFATHRFCDSSERWFYPLELDSSHNRLPASFHPTANGQRLGYEAAFSAKLK